MGPTNDTGRAKQKRVKHPHVLTSKERSNRLAWLSAIGAEALRHVSKASSHIPTSSPISRSCSASADNDHAVERVRFPFTLCMRVESGIAGCSLAP